MLVVPFSIAMIVVGALKSTISHVTWSFRSLHFEQTSLITVSLVVSPVAPLSSRENFKDCPGSGWPSCTEGVFGSLRN
jgi:hypothetical protein